jgi:hypothetical protein
MEGLQEGESAMSWHEVVVDARGEGS